ARALRNAQTGLLGFALHHVNDPIYAEMVECAQAEATGRGYSIILMDTAELAERGEHFRAIVQAHRVDGLLIQSGFGRGEESLREIARSIPSVAFGGAVEGIRTVRLDDEAAARIATEHLLESGHTAIAFVGADGVSSTRRYEGYLKALAAAGLPALPSIDGGWTSDEAHDATVQLLASGTPVTGIVVVTTTTALGVHSGIIAAGRRIPDDVSLISVHDTWFARHLNPPLTVVSLPMDRAGTLGVSMLIEQIQESSAGEVVVTDPPPTLIVRGSTTSRGRARGSTGRSAHGIQRGGRR
ncbi:MAG TPA: substrate-binding domain-containing protein, partial [Nakamurella sp.]|nr:substrate-binding domain-containing protein [Nakamurella sp.]